MLLGDGVYGVLCLTNADTGQRGHLTLPAASPHERAGATAVPWLAPRPAWFLSRRTRGRLATLYARSPEKTGPDGEGASEPGDRAAEQAQEISR